MPEIQSIEIMPETNIRTAMSTASAETIYGVTRNEWVRVSAQAAGEAEGFAWWQIALPTESLLAERRMPFVPALFVRADRMRLPAVVAPSTPATPSTPTTPVAPPTPATPATPSTPVTPSTPTPSPIGSHPALPALPRHLHLGIHLLELGKPEMDVYLNAGCRSFTCMNNVSAAREARDAGSAVIFRKFIDHGIVPDPRQHVKSMGLQASDRLMVMGLNEADNLPTDDLRRRFAWDKAFAEAVWELLPNCFPVLGSFSMGTPQIENPTVAALWRETYGAFLNANWQRAGLNYHSYSGRPASEYPPFDVQVIQPKWFEMRHLRFSYDPALGALDRRVVLVSDESGVDVGGKGGFRDCGYTDAQLERWWTQRLGLFAQHPQQYVFNLFQGDARNARWAGYNVQPFLNAITRIWRGELTRGDAGTLEVLPTREVDEASPLPADWQPAPKTHG